MLDIEDTPTLNNRSEDSHKSKIPFEPTNTILKGSLTTFIRRMMLLASNLDAGYPEYVYIQPSKLEIDFLKGKYGDEYFSGINEIIRTVRFIWDTGNREYISLNDVMNNRIIGGTPSTVEYTNYIYADKKYLQIPQLKKYIEGLLKEFTTYIKGDA